MWKLYRFIYYKLYSLLEKSSAAWWSDFKAGLFIACAEGLLIALLEFKIHQLFGIACATKLGQWGYVASIGGPPIVFNYFYFQYGDRWKKIIAYFDNEVGEEEKRKLNWQVAIVLLVTVGFVGCLFIL